MDGNLGKCKFFYRRIEKSTNIISKNVGVLLKLSLIGISVHCADLRRLSYLFTKFFDTNFIEIKMKITLMATIFGWFLHFSIGLSNGLD